MHGSQGPVLYLTLRYLSLPAGQLRGWRRSLSYNWATMRFSSMMLALTAMLALVLRAQEQLERPLPAPIVLENRGKPIELPFHCSADDMRWAGMSCSEEEPCPIFLELSAAGHAGGRTLVSGNIHGEAVTLYSVLLGTDDVGQTWREVNERIRGAAIDRMQFLDSATGWISGEELFPIPQNPFLLLTEDGGKTWTQRAVLHESTENRFGAVMQFDFSTKSNGSLILDRGQGSGVERYALFQSENGGQSWTVRQESGKPLKLPQTLSASDWRVRADAASRSYHVERRLGERWSLIAAFAVRLEPCKPPALEPGAEKQ